MALLLAKTQTIDHLLDYAVAAANGSKKRCPTATVQYAAAADVIAQKKAAGANAYDITNMRNMLKGINNTCDAEAKKRARSTGATSPAPSADPATGGAGPLSFMDALPGPKWLYFVGVGALGVTLIFPDKVKRLLSKK